MGWLRRRERSCRIGIPGPLGKWRWRGCTPVASPRTLSSRRARRLRIEDRVETVADKIRPAKGIYSSKIRCIKKGNTDKTFLSFVHVSG